MKDCRQTERRLADIPGLRPFRHLVLDQVFPKADYVTLVEAARALLSSDRAWRPLAHYDARILPIEDAERAGFAPLLDMEFLKSVACAMGMDALMEVAGGLHEHPPGSRSGWIHNDFNPGWFVRSAGDGELILSGGTCNYEKGPGPDGPPAAVQRMRAIAMIYYLDNDGWARGDGGETFLYDSRYQNRDQPSLAVEPIDNRMLVFECTPHSWHSFHATRRRRRSVCLWLHREWASTGKLWPFHEPVFW